MSEGAALQYGLAPVYDKSCRLLILGSFPSVMSRGNFYYGNPRNRMWDLLSELTGKDVPEGAQGRREFLLSCGIAMWDMVAYCDIKGSGDADIKIRSRDQINDIPALIRGGNIRAVLCNGSKSYSLLCRYFDTDDLPDVRLMPSTSPANVRFDAGVWREAFNLFYRKDPDIK